MEQRLKDLDSEDQTPYHLASRREDRNLARKALVSDIENKLSAYGNSIPCVLGIWLSLIGDTVDGALETYYRQIERPRPKERNIESVARWLEGNKPLSMPESSFMNDWGDFMAPSDRSDHGGLDAAVANLGALLHRWGMPTVFFLPLESHSYQYRH